jgi:hypothetical protein
MLSHYISHQHHLNQNTPYPLQYSLLNHHTHLSFNIQTHTHSLYISNYNNIHTSLHNLYTSLLSHLHIFLHSPTIIYASSTHHQNISHTLYIPIISLLYSYFFIIPFLIIFLTQYFPSFHKLTLFFKLHIFPSPFNLSNPHIQYSYPFYPIYPLHTTLFYHIISIQLSLLSLFNHSI